MFSYKLGLTVKPSIAKVLKKRNFKYDQLRSVILYFLNFKRRYNRDLCCNQTEIKLTMENIFSFLYCNEQKGMVEPMLLEKPWVEQA
jgi:hypothetical protein